ncbi:MAG: signal recognition particle-docking protein FtsY [Candidatus Dormiibacterota bacterium]
MTETRKAGIVGRLAARLASSTAGLRGQLSGLAAYGPIDEGFWEALEATLLSADLGPEVALRLAEDLRREAERLQMKHSKEAIAGLRTMLLNRMEWRPRELTPPSGPSVYLVVGVNGTGKTTSAAKLAARFIVGGQRVVLGAADTFRAGAIEQLRLWSERIGADFVGSEPGADPASVAFSSVEAGVARGAGAVVIDTAGRLHTQANLMEELKKVERSVAKALEGAPHESLLVLDAAIGQNSIQQARVFNDALKLTGLVLTKLDGSSKGGVILGLEEQLGVPVKLVGVGEKAEDLQDFDPRTYVDSLFDAPND